MAPGLLFVTMQPKDGLELPEFNDWYNNEHGPTRLRLPFIKNGYRYRAVDLETTGKGQPEWLAMYDITDMEELTKDTYTSLRLPQNKSQREIDVMKRITVGRKLFDLRDTHESGDFEELDTISSIGKGGILVATTFTLNPEHGTEEELGNWFNQEHAPLVSKVAGHRRSRWYKTSTIAPEDKIEYIGIHEFKPENGITPEAMAEVTGTEWAIRIRDLCTQDKSRRIYSLYYTFGPAPRELDVTTEFTSPNKNTKTTTNNIVESFITTKDGVRLDYRLEGAKDDTAPLVVLSNCVMTTWGLWDSFVSEFLPNNQKYRILRYNSRGRTSNAGSQSVTVDVLAADIITILDALRVPQAILIGDSLGGATVLNTALKYPSRVSAFISCDTNAASPSGNSKAWGDRVAIAEKEAATVSGEAVVGDELAEATVRRWFYNENGSQEQEIARIKSMVRNNSLPGFKKVVEALFNYDLRSEMKSAKVKGLFVVGAQDGVLPKTMQEMAASYGSGTRCFVVDGAGHLPMVEKPREFTTAVVEFLS